MNLVSSDSAILKTPSTAVLPEDMGVVIELCKEMFIYMIKKNGVGLAANQIGITKTFFVMLPNVFVINPKIIFESPDKEMGEEGCLSFPGIRVQVERSKQILVEYLDELGHHQNRTFKGVYARIFMHEFSHLQGITILDKK